MLLIIFKYMCPSFAFITFDFPYAESIGRGPCGIKKCMLKLHVRLGSVETYWSLSASVFCHVFESSTRVAMGTGSTPQEELQWMYSGLSVRNASAGFGRRTLASVELDWSCLQDMPLSSGCVCSENSSTHEYIHADTHSVSQQSWCIYPMSPPFVFLLVSLKLASMNSVTQQQKRRKAEKMLTWYFPFLTPSHPSNTPPLYDSSVKEKVNSLVLSLDNCYLCPFLKDILCLKGKLQCCLTCFPQWKILSG